MIFCYERDKGVSKFALCSLPQNVCHKYHTCLLLRVNFALMISDYLNFINSVAHY